VLKRVAAGWKRHAAGLKKSKKISPKDLYSTNINFFVMGCSELGNVSWKELVVICSQEA
jgi:hypothetical protein